MNLNELIHEWFEKSKAITAKLTQYSNKPAIFHETVPGDTQEGWSGKTQYPRICYAYDLQVNHERSSVGTLIVGVHCQAGSLVLYELTNEIKRCLKDVLMKPDGEAPFCFSWSRTDAYDYQEGVKSTEIRFDIFEYSVQQTTDPDPVIAMLTYVKNMYPDTVVIGLDRLERHIVAAKKPVFYCRLETTEKGLETNTVVWMNCKIGIHVICPDVDKRQKILAGLTNAISLDGAVTMLDGSPMRFKKLIANYKSDYLTEGQIMAYANYGLLRYPAKGKEIAGVKLQS